MTTDFAAYRDRFQARLFAGMPEHVERLGWRADRIAEHQQNALRNLLSHAIEKSPFHARRLAGIDPRRFELADLVRLPVMTKTELMAEFDVVLTDRRLSRRLVEDAIERTARDPIPLFDEFLCQTSGGSSGRRGVFVLDSAAGIEFTSAIMRPMVALLMQRGGPPPGGLTFALVAAPSAVHATGMAPPLMEGSPTRFASIPVTMPTAEIVGRLNELQPDGLFGYPSLLARLATEQRAGRLRIAPAILRSTSETLLPEQRTAIRDAFGAPLVDTFGASEGLVGNSEPDDPVLVFASDLCIVELVDEHDQPVAPGAPSARILVTNLCNRAQPLIRYAIDDSFVREPDAPGHGHLRARVSGRSDEVLRYGETEVHPLVIRTVMVKTPEVAEYQVRQTPTGIDVSVLGDGRFDSEGLAGRLRAALAQAGLASPGVAVREVASLERHAGTGKLRRFVPLTAARQAACIPRAGGDSPECAARDTPRAG